MEPWEKGFKPNIKSTRVFQRGLMIGLGTFGVIQLSYSHILGIVIAEINAPFQLCVVSVLISFNARSPAAAFT